MPKRFLMPSKASLKGSLSMIYGEDPNITDAPEQDFESSYVATYVDSDNKPVAYCFCDLSASASLACALSLIPIPTALEMISDADLSSIALENLGEVMNIFSSLFMDDTTDHLHLTQISTPQQVGEIDLQSLQTVAYLLSDLNYPSGQIRFSCVA